MGLTRDDCVAITDALAAVLKELPPAARAARVTLRTMSAEYSRAVAMYDRAAEDGLDPEIVMAGGLASGDSIMVAGGVAEVRRMSDTGIERNADGYWGWENISGRTAPLVAVSRFIE